MKMQFALLLVFVLLKVEAQISLSTDSLEINFEYFEATGIVSNADSGQLDTDNWAIFGMSQGNIDFEDSGSISGDFARGLSTGNVSTGGLYAFEVSSGIRGVGIQATGSDFSPGSLVLRIKNETGSKIDAASVQYDLWINNDQHRASYYEVSVAVDTGMFTRMNNLSDSSEQDSDNLGFNMKSKYQLMTNLCWYPETYLYLKWESDDLSGSGSRDEFALSEIRLDIARNIPEKYTEYYADRFITDQLSIDISRFDQGIDYSWIDPLGKEISTGVSMTVDVLNLIIPSEYEYVYLKLGYSTGEQYFRIHP